ncbi:hypothetical protein FACS1894141_0490 [Spirochaetia bacterium]|nr:hypothetical protein FACS1894141_0490 [Spirochaetia bacterium]
MELPEDVIREVIEAARYINHGSIEIIVNQAAGYVDIQITERKRVIGQVAPQLPPEDPHIPPVHKHYRKK